jgi:hypothetical protein
VTWSVAAEPLQQTTGASVACIAGEAVVCGMWRRISGGDLCVRAGARVCIIVLEHDNVYMYACV